MTILIIGVILVATFVLLYLWACWRETVPSDVDTGGQGDPLYADAMPPCQFCGSKYTNRLTSWVLTADGRKRGLYLIHCTRCNLIGKKWIEDAISRTGLN